MIEFVETKMFRLTITIISFVPTEGVSVGARLFVLQI